jgi:hypothetical protein
MAITRPLKLAIDSEEKRVSHMEEAQKAASKLNEMMLIFIDATQSKPGQDGHTGDC